MSTNSGSINAIQIECNYTGVRDTSSNRASFASALTDALDLYFHLHGGMKLNTLAPPPSISRFSDITIDEDNSTFPLPFTLGDPTSTVAATSSSSSLVSSTGFSFVGSGANRTLTITPQPNASGSKAMVTVAATSPDGGVGVEWFYLTVNPVNDAPIFSSVTDRTINPGFNLTLPNTATDVENDLLTYQIVSGLPTNAIFNPTNGTIIWRPTLGQAGQSFFIVVRATDNGTNILSATNTNTVNVAPVQTPMVTTTWSNLLSGSNTSPVLQLSIQGQTGPDYILMASTNLTNWIPIFTNTPTTFPFVWTDTNTSQYPKRFYQLRLGP